MRLSKVADFSTHSICSGSERRTS